MAGAASVSACGSDESLPTVDCSGTIPTYAQVTLLSETCASCHASTLSGTERNGAPTNINFDTYAGAMAHAEKAVSEVYGGDMPPGGEQLDEAKKQQLYLWGLCGTPQ